MALAASAVWEVRSDGSSGNGGFFNASNVNVGTDFSQQAAAQISVTNGVANGTSTVTSATAGFGASHPGNGIKIGSSWYEVVSVSNATTIIVDRTISAASGLTMKLGGAVDSPNTIVGVRVAGNVAYVKATATYSITSTWTLSDAGSDGAPFSLIGYTTTRGDNGQVTVKWTGAGSGVIIDVSGALNILRNFIVDGNGKTADRGLRLNAANCVAINCHGKDCNLSALDAINTGTLLYRCTATTTGSATSSGGINLTSGGLAHSCISYANAKNGFITSNSVGYLINCIARGNTTNGLYCFGTGGFWVFNSVSYGNTGDGLRLDGTPEDQFLTIFNTIFASNTGYGINATAADYSVAANAPMHAARRWNNAFYNNTAGVRNQFSAGNNAITLTVDPFTNAAGNDFSLNDTTGGGASLRGAGVPGGIGLLAAAESTGYADVGAVQGLASAPATTLLTDMRTLWRELTGEKDTEVVPNTTVDVYIQRGLEALNRVAKFYIKTDTSSVVLVNGTQEYTLPADVVEIMWVRWNSADLKHEDIELWRQYEDEWSVEKSAPTTWAHEGNRIIFRPIPNAEAVATAASPRFRYVANPPSVTTSSFDQLGQQDAPVAVYWGVYLWSQCYPDSAVASARAKMMQDIFEAESQRIAANYQRRQTGR